MGNTNLCCLLKHKNSQNQASSNDGQRNRVVANKKLRKRHILGGQSSPKAMKKREKWGSQKNPKSGKKYVKKGSELAKLHSGSTGMYSKSSLLIKSHNLASGHIPENDQKIEFFEEDSGNYKSFATKLTQACLPEPETNPKTQKVMSSTACQTDESLMLDYLTEYLKDQQKRYRAIFKTLKGLVGPEGSDSQPKNPKKPKNHQKKALNGTSIKENYFSCKYSVSSHQTLSGLDHNRFGLERFISSPASPESRHIRPLQLGRRLSKRSGGRGGIVRSYSVDTHNLSKEAYFGAKKGFDLTFSAFDDGELTRTGRGVDEAKGAGGVPGYEVGNLVSAKTIKNGQKKVNLEAGLDGVSEGFETTQRGLSREEQARRVIQGSKPARIDEKQPENAKIQQIGNLENQAEKSTKIKITAPIRPIIDKIHQHGHQAPSSTPQNNTNIVATPKFFCSFGDDQKHSEKITITGKAQPLLLERIPAPLPLKRRQEKLRTFSKRLDSLIQSNKDAEENDHKSAKNNNNLNGFSSSGGRSGLSVDSEEGSSSWESQRVFNPEPGRRIESSSFGSHPLSTSQPSDKDSRVACEASRSSSGVDVGGAKRRIRPRNRDEGSESSGCFG